MLELKFADCKSWMADALSYFWYIFVGLRYWIFNSSSYSIHGFNFECKCFAALTCSRLTSHILLRSCVQLDSLV
uniref:Uncharacterized protein n=1 Tax=Rhizophora mucronata TaxID=61149 RepID=A0A2P2JH34_RHIMU